ncbi:M81 family metallopeptidase [Arthrobacter sp. 24S4-2]|uniref:M81 family metallopeptidase n=1 Tax=Arthrobacter sp. 24S4-2 TaxID=2575374 RepID=UPI0010C7CAD4|nr:M81 family metallopeptidase [Arthrobacter sp. 24S4-2]QCO96789.1 M81 family metallopeptidase [Arthrobacter sp. 24S4-2]
MKILVAGLLHETNTFAPTPARYENFVNGEGFPSMRRGAHLFELATVNIPIGGFLQAMEGSGHELVPVIWAAASPSGPVESEAFERIVGEITAACATEHPDAVYLDLHGAMVTEEYEDGDGEITRRVRSIVGPNVPIVISLDLHANLSDEMFEMADAMVAYRTYPHVDMAETGRRAAEMLTTLFNGDKLHCQWRRIPFLIPINTGCTLLDPARELYQSLDEPRAAAAVLSIAAGFPAADIQCCSPVVFGYGEDADHLLQLVEELEAAVNRAEPDFFQTLLTPEEAVAQAVALADGKNRPVVIADTQDNPGAGGNATTTGMLRALLDADARKSVLASIFDAGIAAAAHEAGEGNGITATFPGSTSHGDSPLTGDFEVVTLSDGHIRFGGPMMNGNELELGPTAVLRSGNVQVIVTSQKAQIMDRNQLRMAGIVPEDQHVLVLKSSVHFRADFQPIAEDILVACAPGPMAAVPATLPWTNLRAGTRLGPLGPEFIHQSATKSV